MSTIETLPGGPWSNIHGTISHNVDDHRGLAGDPALGGLEQFADHVVALKALLADLAVSGKAMAVQGSTWSFSPILDVQGPGVILETAKAPALVQITGADLAAAPATSPLLVMASGGTKLTDLNAFIEPRGMSLRASGSYCGQSVAGAIGSGVHGSTLDFGAIQNHVRGLLMVVSPTDAVWIEPGAQPLLSDQAVARMGARRVNDADLFGAALVHVGAMGVVAAALIEPAPYFGIEVYRVMKTLDLVQLANLQAGNWRAVAQWLGVDRDPYFVEIIVNPFLPWRRGPLLPAVEAMFTLYFKAPPAPGVQPLAAAALPKQLQGGLDDILKLVVRGLVDHIDFVPTFLLPVLVAEQFDNELTPAGPLPAVSWGTVHAGFKPHAIEGVVPPLHNDSFCVPRDRMVEALEIARKAFVDAGGGHLVWTLRFVGKSEGTLAFTRFDRNLVINMDGIRSKHSTRATGAVRAAFEKAGMPFSQHWGKMGVITPQRLEQEFGPSTDPSSRLARWKKARETLLPAGMRGVFANAGAKLWGLA